MLDSNAISRLFTQNLLIKFSEIKAKIPTYTQLQIAKKLDWSNSTIELFWKDNKKDSFSSRKSQKKKKGPRTIFCELVLCKR